MSCSGSRSCGGSLLGNKSSSKIVRFTSSPRGTALAFIQGADTLAKMELCDWSKSFNQYIQSTIYLESGALNRPIQYGGLGTQVTFLALKVEYVNKRTTKTCSPCQSGYGQTIHTGSNITTNCSCGSNPAYTQTQFVPKSCGGSDNCSTKVEHGYISYIFENNPSEVRYIDDLMLLTGTDEHRIPKMYLSNPHPQHDAIVTIMASTESITFDDIVATSIGDNTITVENLTYTNIQSTTTQLKALSDSGTLVFMRWIDLTSIYPTGEFEINGRIITIKDYVQGTINLSFIDDYNARQAYSLIKWAVCDINNNIITGSQDTDDTAPTINYSDRFTTDIVLNEFPPLNQSTCGTSGTDMCTPIYSSTQGIILKDDLFAFLVDNATDDRDCEVPFTYNNLTIQKLGETTNIDVITELGKYQLTFEVLDNAGNLKTDSFILNVKDIEPPMLIVSNLGLELYGAYTTSGVVPTTLMVGSYIILNNGFNETTIDFVSATSGSLGYIIFNNISTIVEITINVTDFVFDAHGTTLTWNIGEIGTTKTWLSYEITLTDTYVFKIKEI